MDTYHSAFSAINRPTYNYYSTINPTSVKSHKPTERHTSDIIAVNNDFTINYVGSVGHVAFGSNVKRIGEENLIRIDYEDR